MSQRTYPDNFWVVIIMSHYLQLLIIDHPQDQGCLKILHALNHHFGYQVHKGILHHQDEDGYHERHQRLQMEENVHVA